MKYPVKNVLIIEEKNQFKMLLLHLLTPFLIIIGSLSFLSLPLLTMFFVTLSFFLSLSLPPAHHCYRIAWMSSTFSRIRPAAPTAHCGSARHRWSDGSWRVSSPESSWSGTFTQTSKTWRRKRKKRTGVKQQ